MLKAFLSMLISFGFLWHGRDKVWTPTFKGSDSVRFTQAMLHYQKRMDITDTLIFQVSSNKSKICSSVQLTNDFNAVAVTWYAKSPSGCRRVKPEFWALHEACHLRYQHHRGYGMLQTRESETEECMKLYSAKERR
jgi:hypothetical protein